MWWNEIRDLRIHALQDNSGIVDPSAIVEPSAVLDDSYGPISIGARTRVCAGTMIVGPTKIGSDCLIGNRVFLRGPTVIGDDVRVGYSTEIKQALVGKGVRIGPICFVADSRIDENAYLGAMVRTSNQRLDRAPVSVRVDGKTVATGCDKLGCWIGAGTSLGIQVIILPGRIVPARSMFEPRITVDRNYEAGRYRNRQNVERI